VSELIAERVPITLLLNVLAIPLIYVVAIGVGVQAATRRGSHFDVGSNMVMLGLWSVPTMLAGILLIGFFANEQYWHWFPTAGLSERTALDMPFMPHWTDTGDVVKLFAGIVVSTAAMIGVAKSSQKYFRIAAIGTLGFLAAWWMCNALASYPGILFQAGLSLVIAGVGVVFALATSLTVRLVSFALIGMFSGVVLSVYFFEGQLVRGFLFDRIWHLILPTFCLSYGGFAFLSRLMRSAVLENLHADYARTARAKGVTEHDVLWHHVFRNSLLPLITVSASLLPALLAGSVIVESIFSIDGMGKLAIEAVKGRDRELVLSITMVSGVLTLLGYLISDICYSIVDPRVSYD
jgi:ABC-type dipeptide/oligopeptide/nickel transport system permease component